MTAVQPKGAETGLRLGDLTLGILHYQTTPAGRQPLAKSSLIATIDRDKIIPARWNKLRSPRLLGADGLPLTLNRLTSIGLAVGELGDGRHWQCDPSHIACAALSCGGHSRLGFDLCR
jgi:hypothetical protein